LLSTESQRRVAATSANVAHGTAHAASTQAMSVTMISRFGATNWIFSARR